MTVLAYIVSTILVLMILIHAIYSMLKDSRRSLSSDGEIVRNLSRRQEQYAFNLKVIKKELFFRKIKYTLEFMAGAIVICAVIVVVTLSIHGSHFL